MEISTAYTPSEVFAPANRDGEALPRVFVAPQRYIQGPGVLSGIGRYLSLVPARRVALLMSERGSRNEGVQIAKGLEDAKIEHVLQIFGGECSLEEITACFDALSAEGVDCLVAAGGGKCIDAGKAIAFRLGVPVAIAPTLASNDAPCSALSVLYSPAGMVTGVEFYPSNPAVVAIDTQIVAAAPERYLVAGIGDAMATWYEARICMQNQAALTTVGARPTIASSAIGESCAQTLFEHGVAGAAAVANSSVNEALEAIVEANTLLSGIGFESGGLAAAHSVASSLTIIPRVEANYLHGEMVAMGTLTQLMMESRTDEATRVAEFFASVGLPIHLDQVSLDKSANRELDSVAELAAVTPYMHNMPLRVTPESVRTAMLDADRLGSSVARRVGDSAYRRLQDA